MNVLMLILSYLATFNNDQGYSKQTIEFMLVVPSGQLLE